MRKIALRGLLGQKRGALLLWSVVTLAFLFLCVSTTLITSLQKTDEDQRVATYGSWQVMAATGSQAQAQRYAALAGEQGLAAALPMVNVAGTDYFSGGNVFYLTTCSPALEQLAQLSLREGRWPAADGEVVLEYAQLSALGLSLGDSFTVTSELVFSEHEDSIQRHAALLAQAQQQAAADASVGQLQAFRDGSWRDMINTKNMHFLRADEMLFSWWEGGAFRTYAHLFADEANPEGKLIRLADMTEEQFRLVQEAYWQIFASNLDVGKYLSMEEQRYVTGITDLIGCGQRSLRVRIAGGKMQLSIPTVFTVCGVTETVSDRWDSGNLALPTGFINEECFAQLEACRAAVLEKYPDFDDVGYTYLTLLRGEDAAAARPLWQAAAAVYNSGDKEAFFTPYGVWDGEGWQSGVRFGLGDTEAQRRIPLSGWIRPAELPENYTGDRLIPVSMYIPEGSMAANVAREKTVQELALDIPSLETTEVCFDYNGQLYSIPWPEFCAGDFTVEGMAPVHEAHLWDTSMEDPSDNLTLRLNRFAWPSSAAGSGRMLVLVTIILFVTTVCAVFQIFFSQMRKRLRRIVLMKSIGATNRQIAALLGWEYVYFLAASLPVGAALGLGGAKLATLALSHSQGRVVQLYVSPVVLAAALLAGALALALGMAVPCIMAVGVPLTGRTVRKKPLPPPKKEVRQDFIHVTLRGLWANRSRTLGGAALCVFMMLIAVLCLFLGVQFLNPWREAVQRDGKPEYLLQAPYAMSDRQLEEYMTALEELDVCAEVEVWRSAKQDEVLLADADYQQSPLLTALSGGVPVYIGSQGSGASGYPITLYALSSQDVVYQKLTDAVTVGTPDAAAFDEGRQVLLAVPLYRQTGSAAERSDTLAVDAKERLAAAGLRTGFYAEYDGVWQRDAVLQPGDPLSLASVTRMLEGAGGSSPQFVERLQRMDVTVGGIIYYFPEEGVWPIAGSGSAYQVIGSSRVLAALLPNAVRTRTDDEVRSLAAVEFTTGTGTTDFYINGVEGLPREEIDTALLIFARSRYMDIEFYHESSEKLLQDAVNNILLVVLLGLTVVLLALLIFANTVTSDIEAERSRIGILQALGVSQRRLLGRQLYIGLVAAGAAVVLANLVLWAGVALAAALSGTVMGNLLWHYPWGLHAGVCLVLPALITGLYVLPMHSLRRYLPIENIKSRK